DNGILYCRIPNSNLAIRIWAGGLERYGLYCFDFFDVVERVPVNTPDGYVISYCPHPGVYSFKGKLVSWETAMKVDRVPAGMEKYSAPEGSRLVLTCPGKEPYYFEIPRRPFLPRVVFAQPQLGIPY
ncbi:hypothetical protein J3A83DRAFT_4085557, partial [Scleroderma citrinum]